MGFEFLYQGEPMLTMQEFCFLTDTPYPTLKDWLRDGKIQCHTASRRNYIPASEIWKISQ